MPVPDGVSSQAMRQSRSRMWFWGSWSVTLVSVVFGNSTYACKNLDRLAENLETNSAGFVDSFVAKLKASVFEFVKRRQL